VRSEFNRARPDRKIIATLRLSHLCPASCAGNSHVKSEFTCNIDPARFHSYRHLKIGSGDCVWRDRFVFSSAGAQSELERYK